MLARCVRLREDAIAVPSCLGPLTGARVSLEPIHQGLKQARPESCVFMECAEILT